MLSQFEDASKLLADVKGLFLGELEVGVALLPSLTLSTVTLVLLLLLLLVVVVVVVSDGDFFLLFDDDDDGDICISC